MTMPGERAWRSHIPALLLLLALQAIVLLPMFPPWRWGTHLHNDDARITSYMISWGQHVLWTRPWDYFAIPLFHPVQGMKAVTETNQLMELVTAPLRIFRNPVLGYNVLMVLNAVLAGMAAYALCFWVTRRRIAAVFGGLVFSGNGYMIWHLWGHPNICCTFPIPLAALCYLKWRKDGRAPAAIGVGVAMVLQFAASLYLGVILGIGLGAMWLFDAARAPRRILCRGELKLIGAVAAAMAVSLALASPYRAMNERLGASRGLDQATLFSASVWSYLLPSHMEGGPEPLAGVAIRKVVPIRTRMEEASFAGWLPLALAASALAWAWRRRENAEAEIVRQMSALALVGFVLSLGPFLWTGNKAIAWRLPFYFIYEYIPPLRFLRATARFSVLCMLAISVGGAVAVARIEASRRLAPAGLRILLAGMLIALLVEYTPISAPATPEVSRDATRAIAELPPDSILAPFPFDSEQWLPTAALKFHPTVTGTVGGVYNHRYRSIRDALTAPMSDQLLARIAATGANTLVVENAVHLPIADNMEGLKPITRWDGGAVYRIEAAPDAAFAAWMSTLPERPDLSHVAAPPAGYAPWKPVRWIVATDTGEWIEYTGDPAMDGFISRGGSDRIGVVAGGVPLAPFRRLAIEFRHDSIGIDHSQARVQWITTRRPLVADSPSIWTTVSGTHDWQYATFDIGANPAFDPTDEVLAFILELPAANYPGMKCEIRGIGVVGVYTEDK